MQQGGEQEGPQCLQLEGDQPHLLQHEPGHEGGQGGEGAGAGRGQAGPGDVRQCPRLDRRRGVQHQGEWEAWRVSV